MCTPISQIINHSIKTGSWPDSYKVELITPIGKKSPAETLDDIRPISNLPILNKIQESVISDMVVSDMKSNIDPKQYGNQRRTSIQHYLVKMMDRIVTSGDSNSKGQVNAVLATFVDWKSAYSRQDHTLGIISFKKNGVRPSLLILLVSYFHNRIIKVKHHGKVSTPRNQPRSGAQGASLGNQEFISQTNENANCVPIEDRFKYVDDLSILEIINLLSIGMTEYKYEEHVPSDIPTDAYFVENKNLKSQNFQFSTRLQLEEKNIEIVNEMKILGTIISDTLSWNSNTS